MCALREKAHLQKDYIPKGDPETLTQGTYYLVEIDDMYRRKYEVKS
jgi:hydroxymethylglutaryl-CoA synthase